jgi:hypothetical protein
MFRKLINPSTACNHFCLPSLILVLVFFLLAPGKSAAAGNPMELIGTTSRQEIQIPRNLSAAEIDSFLASLSDEQVRKFLVQKLKQEADADAASAAKGQAAINPAIHLIKKYWRLAQPLQ